MMQRKKLGVDVILDVLNEALVALPHSTFLKSLLLQYQERGGLSKKQLEGLRGKAAATGATSQAKLATLDAIILKKPTRYKSAPATIPTIEPPDQSEIAATINAILTKYPGHKRVLYYQSKLNNRDSFTATEKAELERFKKLLL